MRTSILAAVIAVMGLGVTSVLANPAPAPQATIPPAACGETGVLCTTTGLLGCCTGFFCNADILLNVLGTCQPGSAPQD
ncbi:hypothetical protein OBBRIDRAFT_890729 [Obba rivulosa]|uniref:Uncharacterized protein n=1 Tax=Obba rivulosa TaxID=1052685 RepID=A0A8E2AQE8_9APHY|nr:hypothetical protein OBBRIDRAFT_890729 [Obba rivulosa]